MKRVSMCFAILVCCISARVADADLITGNLSENVNGSSLAFDVHWVATTFTTDNQSYELDQITTVLDTHQNTGGTLFAAIFDLDGFNQPGSSLVELTIGPVGAAPSPVAMTPVSPFTLEANTTYFLVFGANSGSDFVNTSITDSTNQSGPGSIGDQFWETDTINGSWISTNNSALLMQIEGTVVPEPSSMMLGFIAIGFSVTRRYRARLV